MRCIIFLLADAVHVIQHIACCLHWFPRKDTIFVRLDSDSGETERPYFRDLLKDSVK